MERRDAAAVERCAGETGRGRSEGDGVRRRREAPRRWRLVPPAVTPVEVGDVAAGIVGQLRGRGRDRFRRDVEAFLGADGSATYTSFRRTLAGCFRELAAADDGGRTTVLVPAFCSSDFPDAIEGVGLETARYDVDPDTLSLDEESLADGLREDPLAVVSVNVLGYGSPMAELSDRCADRGVALVEALGYALGTEYRGERLGTFGDCAVLNFQQGKPIPVGGGMVASRDPALEFDDEGRPAVGPNLGALAGYAALSRPRPYYAYTRAKELLEGTGREIERATTHPEAKFGVDYEPPFATISDFQGTVARRVFGRLGDHRRHRARTARFYAEAFASCPRVDSLEPVDGLSKLQHVRFPLVAATEALRDRLKTALLDVGIQATTLYDWPAIDPGAFPGAARLQRRVVTLPTHPYVDDRDRRLVVETVRAVARGSDGETDTR